MKSKSGMITKYRIAKKVADEGIEVVIANGKRDGVLVELVLEDRDILCTRFVPSDRAISGVKKWIAHSDGFAKGEVHISEGAVDALCRPHAVSLLPIGVESIVGEFEKDDIVKIIAPTGEQIGVGRVKCDSNEARIHMGEKGAKALIHYDYLFLD